ncbi:efflux RND transporter periplasmic adaptor subunit [Mesorhizobium sp. BR1-1-16]|uniref:efflux RND transporter periplasmic adaptor subunit n=1 Tax=Mesorhizobium sp. BR1-1-16 TaxID=2876653 RepID=UPI001CCEECAD|nr:efflux RND transporter periplasmic adaptor subunit [Mesorhizobium sp. BR1-1-16]MBZ9935776.1 efflux RND transporter periplasmic adaptor subunit [Mesorhizobium sp. BR1-1-16]
MSRRDLSLVRTGRGLLFAAASVAALSLAACNEKNAYVPPPPQKVTIAQPVQQSVTLYMELTGNTDAINQVDLEARVQGFLTGIKYVDGQKVKAGDVLFTIQRDTYQAQLDQSKAALASAQASQENKQLEYNRQNTLVQQQVTSVAKADDAKAQLDQAIAATAQAQADVEVATINLGYTEIKAPFDGVVSNHLQDIGALVGYSGPTKLATIVQNDPIYTYFSVNERQVLLIKEALTKRGKTLRDVHDIPVEIGLSIDTDYPYTGVIDYIAPNVDQNTGTLTVRGVFDNKDSALLPGLFAKVRVPLQKQPNAILVNDTSIATSQAGSYVLVVGSDNKVEQRIVKPGQLEGQLRVIDSGLTKDDWVVVGGNQRAVPGNTVDPEKGDMSAAEPAAAPARAVAPPAGSEPAPAATPAPASTTPAPASAPAPAATPAPAPAPATP